MVGNGVPGGNIPRTFSRCSPWIPIIWLDLLVIRVDLSIFFNRGDLGYEGSEKKGKLKSNVSTEIPAFGIFFWNKKTEVFVVFFAEPLLEGFKFFRNLVNHSVPFFWGISQWNHWGFCCQSARGNWAKKLSLQCRRRWDVLPRICVIMGLDAQWKKTGEYFGVLVGQQKSLGWLNMTWSWDRKLLRSSHDCLSFVEVHVSHEQNPLRL